MKRFLSTFGFICIIYLLFPHNINAQVVINEFVPDSSQEWVEFYNSSASATRKAKKNFPFLSLFLVGSGISFMGFAGYLVIKKQKENTDIING